MFFLPNSIKFIMDRPVEKMQVKKSGPERINSEGPTHRKVSIIFNPLFYMIKYTWKPCNAPLCFVSLFFSKWLHF